MSKAIAGYVPLRYFLDASNALLGREYTAQMMIKAVKYRHFPLIKHSNKYYLPKHLADMLLELIRYRPMRSYLYYRYVTKLPW